MSDSFEGAIADVVRRAAEARARSLDALCWDAYVLQADGKQGRLQVIERHSLGDPIPPAVASDVSDIVFPEMAPVEPEGEDPDCE